MFCNEVVPLVRIALEVEKELGRKAKAQVLPSPGPYGGLVPEPPIEDIVRRADFAASQK